MNIEEALSVLAACIVDQGREDLSPLQEEIIRRCCSGQAYDDMEIPGYTAGYIKTYVAPQLWKLLSEVTGKQVSKKNLKIVLARLQERRLSDPSATPKANVEDVPSNTPEPKLAESEGLHKTWSKLAATVPGEPPICGVWFKILVTKVGDDRSLTSK